MHAIRDRTQCAHAMIEKQYTLSALRQEQDV